MSMFFFIVGKLTEEQFNVELVVQCVRTSDNPQTHNHALLVLTIAAELFPVSTSNNVITVTQFLFCHFTFSKKGQGRCEVVKEEKPAIELKYKTIR